MKYSMKRAWLFSIGYIVCHVLSCLEANSQVTTIPTLPLEGQNLQVIFNATQGSGGLSGYGGDVYAHIGVITSKSSSSSDWKYVKAEWSVNKSECKMVRSATNPNIYTLNLNPSIRTFFGVPSGEVIKQVAIVFRSSDGSKTGKAVGDKDIFVDVSSSELSLKLTEPLDGATFMVGESIPIVATSMATKMDLYINNQLISSSTTGSISYTFKPDISQKYKISVVASNGAGLEDKQNIEVTVIPAPIIEDLPNNAKLGLTVDKGKATFVLEAPTKKNVVLLGSFNGFKVDPNFVMKKTTNGEKFWITIDTLRKDIDYCYQYFVDGTIKIADPYSRLVLDPWNDASISSDTYPNMPSYPKNQADGIVSSFRMNEATYSWQIENFVPASKEKLNIYEVLVRDFVASHSYKTLVDTVKYFKKLGINAVELMPVNEFEGNSSWGYNPSFYFAVDKYYGSANDLKRFVDECHKEGIAVIVDLVLNHSFSQSPLVQLYYNKSTSKVSADNPWYNVDSPNTAYSWGYDFNHESKYTQAFVDSVNAYWMKEFKVDGYRFDFTKGFTQKSGDGWAYDQSRIDILKRMNREILKHNPNAIVIFEHLADNSEEKSLVDDGILLWGNINNNSCEAAMGYNENSKSDLSWASYKQRSWSKPSVVAYMESHDEERIAYKQSLWGKSSGIYNIKNSDIANQHHAALATVFFSIPGPKMIWQWGELGYNYSINTCENGSVASDGDCRTSPKPLFWHKNVVTPENESNLTLKAAYSKILNMRKELDVFSTSSFDINLASEVKHVKLYSSEMNVIAVANLDLLARSFETNVSETGYYYSETTKDSILIVNGKLSKTLSPGEYHLLTSKRLFTPLKLMLTSPVEAAGYFINEPVSIEASSQSSNLTLYVNNVKIAEAKGAISYQYIPTGLGTLVIKVIASDGVNQEIKTRNIIVKNRPLVLTISSPKDGDSYLVGEQIPISATSNSDLLKLEIDNQVVATGTTNISYAYQPGKSGNAKLRFEASNSTETIDSTLQITIKSKFKVGSFGPNPIGAGGIIQFCIEPTSNEEVIVSVYTISGKLLFTEKKLLLGSVENAVTINTGMKGFGKGVYIVKISGQTISISEKIVVL